CQFLEAALPPAQRELQREGPHRCGPRVDDPQGQSGQRTDIWERYLKSTRWAKGATSAEDLKRFEEAVALFRKYGATYDWDDRLLMAQGYQESEFKQSARSPVGAIGVMQIMPAIGKSMKVGDITEIDPNIHAGVKFLRAMMNEYYANEPMDRLNKGLFTFAAYNAGPGRVRGLRKIAAERGLNPNVWFNNVEVIAAEKIGRETVTYVSNIYKYYLAYQMIEEERLQRERAKERLAPRNSGHEGSSGHENWPRGQPPTRASLPAQEVETGVRPERPCARDASICHILQGDG